MRTAAGTCPVAAFQVGERGLANEGDKTIMNVLIIGGTRYMGRLAVEQLLARDDEVTVFSRGNVRPAWWDRVQHIAGDRTDLADFRAKLKGRSFDAVIDMRAFRKEQVTSAHDTFDGTCGRYLMVSTGSVYMRDQVNYATQCPFKESDVDWSSIDYTYPEGQDPYGVGKRHCEKWLQENSRIPYTVIRVPAVFGWDDPTARMWWWVQRALDGREVVVAAEHRGLFRTLYAGDAASTFLRAIDLPAAANQIYHVAMEELVSVERWSSLIWAAAGHSGTVTFVPEAIIRRQPGLDAYAPPLTRAVSTVWDLSKARRDLGFRTTPLARWIQETVDWYRNHQTDDPRTAYAGRAEELALAARWRPAYAELVERF
jgi:nucleoside-diphosphate-sugar epimerase